MTPSETPEIKQPMIEIYTKNGCFYCDRAIDLLIKKNLHYTEINLSEHPDEITVMLSRSQGRKTVPQIFINGQHIGGSDDLYSFDAQGRLDQIIGNF